MTAPLAKNFKSAGEQGLASRFAKLETYVFSSKTTARGSSPPVLTVNTKTRQEAVF